MKRQILILFLYLLASNIFPNALEKDSIMRRLNATIDNKAFYIEQKKQKIKILQEMLQDSHLNAMREYEVNRRLYAEFEKYKTDTALHYLLKNKEIATNLGENKLQEETDLQIAYIYSTKGLFVEAKDILTQTDTKKLPKDLLVQYYKVFGFFYDHYGQNNGDHFYFGKSSHYRDSLLSVIEDTISIDYKILKAEDMMYGSQAENAKKKLSALLEDTNDSNPQRALIAYLIGAIYKKENNTDMQEKYFMISAIADITNVIKDNASLHSLALMYSHDGNIDKANKFMTMAMEDAMECNVKYRASEALESYPIINAAYLEKEHSQKTKLGLYLICISILVVFLICTIVYIYAQMKRVSGIRKELYKSSLKLIELNQNISETNKRLQESNSQLTESNHVKEEYIANFFDICSEYINKMDEYRKSLNKLANEKALDTLYAKLKSTTIVDTQLDELYNRFDNIFLGLFPTFIDQFNSLLTAEEQILPKPGELLNTELRIFALIRLGITDSVRIASFLRYSLRTVYNYRTKVRNKAAVSRDEFEEFVKKISAS